ncbi:MAG: hypothetical protein ABL908_07990, partial [Hyphomicrobium sp.]
DLVTPSPAGETFAQHGENSAHGHFGSEQMPGRAPQEGALQFVSHHVGHDRMNAGVSPVSKILNHALVVLSSATISIPPAERPRGGGWDSGPHS